MLCCGLCRMKVYHRNIFRNLFRRAQNSPLKNGSESPEFAVSSQQQEAKRHLGPPGQESSWSPSLSVTPSSRCTYHWTSRKGSVLSFGDVDSREVHRMMKYINRSKVQGTPILYLETHAIHKWWEKHKLASLTSWAKKLWPTSDISYRCEFPAERGGLVWTVAKLPLRREYL